MSNEKSTSASEAAAAAEEALRAGDLARAETLYVRAAEAELTGLETVPASQARTRGILTVSAVSLLVKGGALERAEIAAHRFLTEPSLPPFAREQLRDALAAVWEELAMRGAGRKYSGEVVSVSLRGLDIGAGRAPLGLVVDRVMGVNSLLYRITEWLGRFPFRTKGPPPDSVRTLCQPWVSEPQPGSYRFAVHLVEPLQLELIPATRVRARQISSTLLDVVRAVSPTTVAGLSANIKELVPDVNYQQAMLKLVRNVVPDGQRIKEIEFTADREDGLETALLHAGARIRIQDSLVSGSPGEQADEMTGVLRAVHLDNKWLELHRETGEPVRCRIAAQVLDDVVGPMLNRRVIVRGKWGRQRAQFRLTDIELDSPGEDT